MSPTKHDFFLLGLDTKCDGARFRIEVLGADGRWHDAGGNSDGIDAIEDGERVRRSIAPEIVGALTDRDPVRVRDRMTGEVLTKDATAEDEYAHREACEVRPRADRVEEGDDS